MNDLFGRPICMDDSGEYTGSFPTVGELDDHPVPGPGLDGSDKSEDRALDRLAIETGRQLIEAYHLQDEREHYLTRSEPKHAAAVAESACDKMGLVWETEFSSVDAERAREGGAWFVRALFVQDEIENWTAIGDQFDRLETVLECGRPPAEPESVESDPRWDTVTSYLRRACESVGIDEAYAPLQTGFWLRHGIGDPSWERMAYEAHTVKLRAMVREPGPHADRLGTRFVHGVQMHDTWDRTRTTRLSETVQFVSAYYRRLFALRGTESP